MGIKDFIYLGLIALCAIAFYLHGLCRPQWRSPRKRKLDVPFNDSGCLTELPNDLDKPARRLPQVPSLSREEIRQTFGDN